MTHPSQELQVRWAEVRPHHGVVGAWIGVVLHLVVLAVLSLVSESGDFVTLIIGGTGAATLVAFTWFCACWRNDAAEATWTTAEPLPPGPRAPRAESPIGLRATWRHGWRPALAWLVGAAIVLSVLRGPEGFAAWIILAAFLAPVAVVFGWLFWLLLVLPMLYFVSGIRRLRRGEDGSPPVGVALVGMSVLLWCVLPMAACIWLSGAADDRYEVFPALLGYGGDAPGSEPLLWVARALAFLVLILAVAGMWWIRREQRRMQERRGGIVRL
ncbi:hypothetical protein [Nocardioides sediminis]|uniref:hypothetical protein n=1 Tax=Nocardioides sediminis TaxID=433648 RepID=UPI000D31267D|nr:hypothetical protein [Nocardioides sediminis]